MLCAVNEDECCMLITAVINHTRPSAQKHRDKTKVLVDVNHLRLLSFSLPTVSKIYKKRHNLAAVNS